jgi:hypothetical protein
VFSYTVDSNTPPRDFANAATVAMEMRRDA